MAAIIAGRVYREPGNRRELGGYSSPSAVPKLVACRQLPSHQRRLLTGTAQQVQSDRMNPFRQRELTFAGIDNGELV
jgi:hypothetical protein